MTAFIIILGIVLFLAGLLFCPVVIRASFEDELIVKARYLFLTYVIVPRKEKEPKKTEQNETGQKEEEEKDVTQSKIKELLAQKGLRGFLGLMKEIFFIAHGSSQRLFRHLVISNISAYLVIATDDASQTALNYSYACAAVYPAFSAIVANCKCKKYSVQVIPDFNKKESEIKFSAKATIKLFFILSASRYAFFQFLKTMKKAKAVEAK